MSEILKYNEIIPRFYKRCLRYLFLSISTIKIFQGDYQQSINKLKKLILIEKDDPDIHWRLGTVYLKINDLKNALNCFQIAVNLGSGQPKYLLWLSKIGRASCRATV